MLIGRWVVCKCVGSGKPGVGVEVRLWGRDGIGMGGNPPESYN